MTTGLRAWLNPRRPMTRSAYWISGVLLFGLKHGIDRVIASQFGRKWSLFNYIEPADFHRLDRLTPTDRNFYASLLAVAIPFILVGVVLSWKRLEDAGLRAWLVVLFFVPFLNLLFFLVLSVLPSDRRPVPRGVPRLSLLARLLPASAAGSAIAGVLLSVAVGILIIGVALRVLQNYGWGLFVGVPFCAGLISAALFGHAEPRTLRDCLLAASLSTTLLGLVVIAVAMEGLVCVLMAAPVAYPVALLGGCVGYAIQRRSGERLEGIAAVLLVPLALPGLMGMERLARLPQPEMLVRSEIVIDASPSLVWHAVVQFAPLPPPREILFRAGIAYPTRAEIRGIGPGAVRRCVFSTGSFVEPIEVWDEPRRLSFSVAEQPRILTELTPYREIHAPHLDRFFESTRGEFLLTRIRGGATHLVGLTWYRHAIWPAAYWRLWSDGIIHTIHMRVLTGIKLDAEAHSRAGGDKPRPYTSGGPMCFSRSDPGAR